MRRALVGLLCAWCILGAVATAAALTGPAVWWNRDTSVRGVVGMPLRGAAETAVIRTLLPEDGDTTPWLVVFPPQSDPQVLTYVRYQLAHLEYPRRVEVVAGIATDPSGDYGGVITAPGLHLPLPWHASATSGGFTANTMVRQ